MEDNGTRPPDVPLTTDQVLDIVCDLRRAFRLPQFQTLDIDAYMSDGSVSLQVSLHDNERYDTIAWTTALGLPLPRIESRLVGEPADPDAWLRYRTHRYSFHHNSHVLPGCNIEVGCRMRVNRDVDQIWGGLVLPPSLHLDHLAEAPIEVGGRWRVPCESGCDWASGWHETAAAALDEHVSHAARAVAAGSRRVTSLMAVAA